jgi:hypothetical protein
MRTPEFRDVPERALHQILRKVNDPCFRDGGRFFGGRRITVPKMREMRTEQNQIPGLKRFDAAPHKPTPPSRPDKGEFALWMKMPRSIERWESQVQKLQGPGISEINFLELWLHCALLDRKTSK